MTHSQTSTADWKQELKRKQDDKWRLIQLTGVYDDSWQEAFFSSLEAKIREEVEQQTFEKCKSIFVSEVDWAEWAKSESDADALFEQKYQELSQPTKETL